MKSYPSRIGPFAERDVGGLDGTVDLHHIGTRNAIVEWLRQRAAGKEAK